MEDLLAARLDAYDVSDSDGYESGYASSNDMEEEELQIDLSDCASYSIHGRTDPLERDHCRFVTCLAGDNLILRSDGYQSYVSELTAGMTLWSVDGAITLHSISKVAPGYLKMFTNDIVKGCATVLLATTREHLCKGAQVGGYAYVLCTSEESSIVCVNGALVDIGTDYDLQIRGDKSVYCARIDYSVSGFVVNVELV